MRRALPIAALLLAATAIVFCTGCRVFLRPRRVVVVQPQPRVQIHVPPQQVRADPAEAGERAPEEPPPPKIEVSGMAPSSVHVWVGGRWLWRDRWVWRPGKWVRPAKGVKVWVPGHWRHGPRGWARARGHWR